MNHEIAYAGERYEVRCIDGRGCEVLVGYTNRADANDLVRRVRNHPVWHSPRVIYRHSEE